MIAYDGDAGSFASLFLKHCFIVLLRVEKLQVFAFFYVFSPTSLESINCFWKTIFENIIQLDHINLLLSASLSLQKIDFFNEYLKDVTVAA